MWFILYILCKHFTSEGYMSLVTRETTYQNTIIVNLFNWRVEYASDEKQETTFVEEHVEGSHIPRSVIIHSHPKPTEMTQLFLKALSKKDFKSASNCIDRLEKCVHVLRGTCSERYRHGPIVDKANEHFLRENEKDCLFLKNTLFSCYVKALEQSYSSDN